MNTDRCSARSQAASVSCGRASVRSRAAVRTRSALPRSRRLGCLRTGRWPCRHASGGDPGLHCPGQLANLGFAAEQPCQLKPYPQPPELHERNAFELPQAMLFRGDPLASRTIGTLSLRTVPEVSFALRNLTSKIEKCVSPRTKPNRQSL